MANKKKRKTRFESIRDNFLGFAGPPVIGMTAAWLLGMNIWLGAAVGALTVAVSWVAAFAFYVWSRNRRK